MKGAAKMHIEHKEGNNENGLLSREGEGRKQEKSGKKRLIKILGVVENAKHANAEQTKQSTK